MYIDTSVAVKLFTPEPDSPVCESIVAGLSLVSSELLYCELRAALRAKQRNGLISGEMLARVWQTFERHLFERRIHLMAFDGAIVREAAAIIDQVHPAIPLRTLDCLHLATFVRMEAGPLFTKDRRMREAAQQMNLPLAN
jgi:predicted nucleic acid-binding protein